MSIQNQNLDLVALAAKGDRNITTQPGDSFPLGATVRADGINFCLYAPSADSVHLLLFDSPTAPQPSLTLELTAEHHKTAHYWHIFAADLAAGQVYAYRASGPYDPASGLRFNPNKVLLDPLCSHGSGLAKLFTRGCG